MKEMKNMAYWKAKNNIPTKNTTGAPIETETEEGNVSAYLKKNQQYVDKDKTIPLSPGFEDIGKIQKVQKLGITPHSQEFGKKNAPTKHTRSRKGHMERYGKGHTNEDHPNYWKEGKDDRRQFSEKEWKWMKKHYKGGVIFTDKTKEAMKRWEELDKKK